MLYKDMEPEQLREAYRQSRRHLAGIGNLARNVTSGRARWTLAGQTGRELREFDLIVNVARKRGIDLLADSGSEG